MNVSILIYRERKDAISPANGGNNSEEATRTSAIFVPRMPNSAGIFPIP
jgi:hypothetical protein